jgi:predicted HAD superfamily Cof-like phosphohydrolase
MNNPYNSLWEFHEAFDLTRSKTTQFPDRDVRKLRIELLREEWEEYLDGESNDDLVEIADALADIVYIAYGTAVSYGIPLDEIFDEVHSSNMSKLGDDGKPVYRDDGKVLKGPRYRPPNVQSILEKYGYPINNG